MLTETQDRRRHSLLGLSPTIGHRGGIQYFDGVSAETLATLVEEGFADPDSTQNSSPTIREFLAYMQAHPKVTAHGYIVGWERSDARVSVEGLHSNTTDPEEQIEFLEWNQGADELSRHRSWWD